MSSRKDRCGQTPAECHPHQRGPICHPRAARSRCCTPETAGWSAGAATLSCSEPLVCLTRLRGSPTPHPGQELRATAWHRPIQVCTQTQLGSQVGRALSGLPAATFPTPLHPPDPTRASPAPSSEHPGKPSRSCPSTASPRPFRHQLMCQALCTYTDILRNRDEFLLPYLGH